MKITFGICNAIFKQGLSKTNYVFISFSRDWPPKFATGLNVVLAINQKYMSDQAVMMYS